MGKRKTYTKFADPPKRKITRQSRWRVPSLFRRIMDSLTLNTTTRSRHHPRAAARRRLPRARMTWITPVGRTRSGFDYGVMRVRKRGGR